MTKLGLNTCVFDFIPMNWGISIITGIAIDWYCFENTFQAEFYDIPLSYNFRD